MPAICRGLAGAAASVRKYRGGRGIGPGYPGSARGRSMSGGASSLIAQDDPRSTEAVKQDGPIRYGELMVSLAAFPTLPATIAWQDDRLLLLDQSRLPQEMVVEAISEVEEVWRWIHELRVRGAPAIG